MINKINSTPAFTSMVLMPYDSNDTRYGCLAKDHYSQSLIRAVLKLEKNDNDDIVTLKTIRHPGECDDELMLQVKETRGNTVYIGNVISYGVHPAEISKLYSKAKDDMHPIVRNTFAKYVV